MNNDQSHLVTGDGFSHRYSLASPIRSLVDSAYSSGSWIVQRWSRLIHARSTINDLKHIEQHISGKKVVSLDFFDTLVNRTVTEPSAVVRKAAELAVNLIAARSGSVHLVDDFLAERDRLEKDLGYENFYLRGLDREVNVLDIYLALLDGLGITESTLAAELVEIEVELEAETLVVNADARYILEKLKARDIRIVVTSDMYLSSDIIRRFARLLGLDDYIDAYYVSADMLLLKKSGRLFEYLLESENVDARQILHVGDKRVQDFVQPRRVGIEALWFCGSIARQENAFSPDWSSGKFNQFLDRGLSGALPAQETRSPFYMALFEGLAPGLFAMAYKSLTDCRRLGINRIYFLARDGISLKQIYDLLIEKHPEFTTFDFRTSVLFCSRASTVCSRYKGIEDVECIVKTVGERFESPNAERLLSAWNLELDEIGGGEALIPSFDSFEGLRECLKKKDKFTAAFDQALWSRQALLRDYLEQEGVFDGPCAFVDVGWGGTIQKHVKSIASHYGKPVNIFGIYAGTDARIGLGSVGGYLFGRGDYRSGSIMKSAALVETLLGTSSIGSTRTYASENEQIVPVGKESPQRRGEEERLRQEAFDAFYPFFVKMTRQWCVPCPDLLEYGRQRFFDLVVHPNRELLHVIQQMSFQFDWGIDGDRLLITPLTPGDLFPPTRALGQLWRTPWVFGSLSASRLGWMNTPVAWILGLDERITRRIFDVLKRALVGRDLPDRVI